MKIIVIGSDGQLGKCLQDQVKKLEIGSYYIFFSKRDVDISKYNETTNYLEKVRPNLIINASGYTHVDNAEKDYENADIINNKAVRNLASISKKLNATLVHISTDYVFDGDTNRPYVESSHKNPLGVYGKTKSAGEESIKSSGCKYIILRTSWVFSEYGNNFMKSIIKLTSSRETIKVVDDQYSSPTYAQDIAKLIIQFASIIHKGKVFKDIFHFSGDRPTSWHKFANKILNEQKKHIKGLDCKILPISSNEYNSDATRPAFSVLDCTKLKNQYDVKLSDWSSAIEKVVLKLH